MLVDSHAHLDSDRYAEDREAMLVRAYQAGVETILAVGIGEGPGTMHAALDLSREYRSRQHIPQIVVSAGIHPHEASLADESALNKLDALAAEPEVVAIGEIGLDYFYDHSPREVQQRVFVDQMKIAAAHKRPILIHCRASVDSTNAWDDALALLDEHWRATGLGGVLHCFAGEYGHAKKAMDMNFLVSFAGNITYPKAQPIRDVAAKLPAERILIETDAPFLAPVPNRGKRNEPAMVGRVAKQLGEVRGMDYETMALTTTENFYRFFHLSPTTRAKAREIGTDIGTQVEN